MFRTFAIARKDLTQLLRERKTFLFLLIMPLAFTLLFGYASGAFNHTSADPRLPVAFIDEDHSRISHRLGDLLAASTVIRLETSTSSLDAENFVAQDKLAAALVVPADYGHNLQEGHPARLLYIGDPSTAAGRSVESDVLVAMIHLESALRLARVTESLTAGQVDFTYTFEKALNAWQTPPVHIAETSSSAVQILDDASQSLAHTSPGMMLQFAVASLLTSATVLVDERKRRCLQRLRSTPVAPGSILTGHYLALLALTLGQFTLLIAFGQLALKVNYLRAPWASLLVAGCAASCVAALGLLIGVVAHSEEQAIIFSLVLMFLLSGLGGAWVPLEVTGATFQTIAHLTPLAWAMDGFQNILLRGQGLEAVRLPAAILLGYTLLFLLLAAWRFSAIEGGVS
jgi:ABC-2 type transport system permease protein